MYILKHMLIKPKKIFEYCSCFWKVFCFEKFQKKSINFSTLPFGDSLVSHEFSRLSRKFTLNGPRLFGESDLSREKHLNFFSKIWVFDFLATHSQVASSSKGIRNSLASRNPSCEKDLEKIFKILFKGFW